MKKIVVFLGSPRKNGYSARLAEQVIAGAKSKGADVMVCDLNEDGIKGCQGCNYCKTHTECVQNEKNVSLTHHTISTHITTKQLKYYILSSSQKHPSCH